VVSSIFGSSSSGLGLANNLNRSLSKVNSALSRLSSGARITKASDDAAGLAVIASIQQSLTATDRASSNVADASSALAIADGALSQIQDLSSRLQELAVQSSNGLYTDDQRSALKSEFNSVSQEIQRITQTTEFNGTKLLDGSPTQVQIGGSGSTTSTLQVGGVDLSSGIAQLSALDIGTQSGAQAAIDTVQKFVQGVSIQRGSAIGAAQTQLASIYSGLSSQNLAQRESLSRIADADIAAESAALMRNSILAQSGVAVMAQSNRLSSTLVQRLIS